MVIEYGQKKVLLQEKNQGRGFIEQVLNGAVSTLPALDFIFPCVYKISVVSHI